MQIKSRPPGVRYTKWIKQLNNAKNQLQIFNKREKQALAKMTKLALEDLICLIKEERPIFERYNELFCLDWNDRSLCHPFLLQRIPSYSGHIFKESWKKKLI